MFASLAVAQQQCNFQHRDLRLSNVMEHRPPSDLKGSRIDPSIHNDVQEDLISSDQHDFKIIDFGHASVKHRCVVWQFQAISLSCKSP